MKIDYSLIGHTSRNALVDAQRAESWGFDGVWATESVTDAFLQSMAVALSTERVDIGTAIAVAFARNPMTTAYCAWDIASASGGRFTLGMGTQIQAHITKRFSMPWSSPAARMEDYIKALRAIFESWRTGSRLRYEGEHYRHTLMTPVFTPPHHDHPIPIAIAAVGEVMTALAGRLCDGVILHGMTNPEYLDTVTLPALEKGLAESGRSRAAFTVSLPLFFAMGDTEEQIVAQREESRKQLAFYASTPAYRGVLEAIGYGDLQTQLHSMSKTGEWDKMATAIDDTLLDAMVLTGAPEEIPALVYKRFGNRFDRVSSYYGWTIDDPERMADIVKKFHSYSTTSSH
jgi:probable F420-dependent oxidoreductase